MAEQVSVLTQIARPYAAALFDLATSEGSVDKVEAGNAGRRLRRRFLLALRRDFRDRFRFQAGHQPALFRFELGHAALRRAPRDCGCSGRPTRRWRWSAAGTG